jgi:sulfate/thiosulfate transport system substrate-binding protein
MEIVVRRALNHPVRTARGHAPPTEGEYASRSARLHRSRGPTARAFAALAVAALGLVVLAGCGGPAESSGNGGGTKLSLVAYSTPKEAYAELIPAFNKTARGRGVSFTQSYGASGDQSRAVAAGLPADVVAFSLAPDVDKLVEPGIVSADWAKDPYDGFVTDSVVVFAVRRGNPKHIETWDDLVKPGVEVVTPNPFTSGGARWNLMAAYGAQIKQGKSPDQALAYLKALLENTPVQDKSAREALATFAGGKGDVMLAYENEAITAQKKSVDLDYVIPDQTILIQNPIAVTQSSKSPEKAKAFVSWLRSPEAQKIFQSKGYRSVREELADPKRYPTPKDLFKIDDLGGWSKVNDEFFDPDNGSMAKIEQDLGVSTAK